jgi:hypothetical protein
LGRDFYILLRQQHNQFGGQTTLTWGCGDCTRQRRSASQYTAWLLRQLPDRLSWRENVHDDLDLVVALAVRLGDEEDYRP